MPSNSRRFVIIFALVPVLWVSFLLVVRGGTEALNFAPLTHNDEGFIWHQGVSFGAVGFNSGYYTLDEIPSPNSNYYAWGLGRPIFYGISTALFNWHPSSIVWLNMILVTIAGALFFYYIPLNTMQILSVILVMCLYPGFIVYFHLSMTEVTQISFAWFWITGFLMWQKYHIRWLWWALFIFNVILILFNLTWFIFLLPLIYYRLKQRNLIVMLLITFLTTGFFAFLAYRIYSVTAAPYSGLLDFQAYDSNLIGNIVVFIQIAIQKWTIPLEQFAFHNTSIRIIMVSIFIWSLLSWLRMVYVEKALRVETFNRYAIYLLPSLTILLIVTIVDSSWSIRQYLPILFALLLVIIINKKKFILTLSMLFLMLTFPESFVVMNNSMFTRMESAQTTYFLEIESILDDIGLEYDPDAPNPWCNTTLLVKDLIGSTEHIMTIPTGMGVSWTWELLDIKPIKSKYIFMYRTQYDEAVEEDPDYMSTLTVLTEPYGTIILENENSLCYSTDIDS